MPIAPIASIRAASDGSASKPLGTIWKRCRSIAKAFQRAKGGDANRLAVVLGEQFEHLPGQIAVMQNAGGLNGAGSERGSAGLVYPLNADIPDFLCDLLCQGGILLEQRFGQILNRLRRGDGDLQ